MAGRRCAAKSAGGGGGEEGCGVGWGGVGVCQPFRGPQKNLV